MIRLKEDKVYRSIQTGCYYKVVEINEKFNQVRLYDVRFKFEIKLSLGHANEILKPVPKLKRILLLES